MANDGTGQQRNAKPKVVMVDGNPRICLFALRDINMDEQIMYEMEIAVSRGERYGLILFDEPKSIRYTDCSLFDQRS